MSYQVSEINLSSGAERSSVSNDIEENGNIAKHCSLGLDIRVEFARHVLDELRMYSRNIIQN